MKMKRGVVLLIMICVTGYSYGQRHMKGFNSIDFTGGLTKFGGYGDVNYAHYLNAKSYIRVGLMGEFGKIKVVPYRSFLVNASYNYKLYSIKNIVYLNGFAGVTANIDKWKYSKEVGSEDIWKANYGAIVGLETETYINDRYAWTVNGWQAFTFNQNYARYTFYLGTGLRISLTDLLK